MLRQALVRVRALGGVARVAGASRDLSSKKLFLLEYHYVDNMIERRNPVRADHLAYAQKFVDSQILVAGGATVPDVKSGIIVFRSHSAEEVEQFAKGDPYTQAGLIKDYTVREWNVVIGKV